MNEYRLTLTQAQMMVLQDALMLLPFGRVAPLVNDINRQIQEQNSTPPPSNPHAGPRYEQP